MIITGFLMGLGATVLLDLWQIGLAKAGGPKPSNWGMVGRWVGHLPGTVFHKAIAETAPVPQEVGIGWAFHYFVGVVYGIALALLMGPDWLAAPTLLPAVVFGVVTIVMGWFLLQPGMGLGMATSRAGAPWAVRINGLVGHSVFGVGLWLVAVLLA